VRAVGYLVGAFDSFEQSRVRLRLPRASAGGRPGRRSR